VTSARGFEPIDVVKINKAIRARNMLE